MSHCQGNRGPAQSIRSRADDPDTAGGTDHSRFGTCSAGILSDPPHRRSSSHSAPAFPAMAMARPAPVRPRRSLWPRAPGCSVHRGNAADGIHRVVNTRMAEGIRLVSVRRGVDPRRVAVLAFGGAAGLHITDAAPRFFDVRVRPD